MHAIKGGWVGQTFALAKCNDSGGRKSRIRRSKEERKAMVESFIKKYQNSNNGNFPSLNLTHKEVGGSFYTVREIVREIIQENRVLGPAKLIPEEQNSDIFAEQYPLGSISIEPQLHLLSENGNHIASNNLGTSEEIILNSSEECTGPEYQKFDNGRVVNGSPAEEKNKESDELMQTEMQISETLEADKDVAEELEASTARVSQLTADVIVETFPLSPVTKQAYSLNGSSSEASDLIGTLEEKETEKVELEPENFSSVLNQGSLEDSFGLADEKATANLASPLSERNSGLGDGKAMVNLAEPSLESSNCFTTKEGIVHDIQDGADLEESHSDVLTLEIFEQGQSISGTKPIIAPKGMHTKSFNGANTSSRGVLDSQEVMVIENKVNVQHSGNSQKGSNPTLDRINLESWDGVSKKPAESETNPLMAFLKAFVAAFVKFWSE